MSITEYAIQIENLTFRYGQRVALDQVNLAIEAKQIFALLGPNGSGKSTLFRVLSTLESTFEGSVRLFGMGLRESPNLIRRTLGVVFQSASLDRKLTVLENIRCQAALYGLRGPELAKRIDQVTEQLRLRDRLDEYIETLSGGLKRRVELAKGILHRPRLLLLDEPSTGLDPAARIDFWQALSQLRETDGVSVVLTTHLLDEADKADRLAILDQGKVVADGSPAELRSALGSQVLSIQASSPSEVVDWLVAQNASATLYQQQVRATGQGISKLIAPLSERFGNSIQSITLGQPNLEDVFIARTGHQFWNEVQQS